MNKRQKKKAQKLASAYVCGFTDGWDRATETLSAAWVNMGEILSKCKAALEAIRKQQKEDKDDDMDKNRPVG